MRILNHDIGVCSWSLRQSGMHELIGALQAIGLSHVHLALGPMLALERAEQDAQTELLRASGISITAGMIAHPGEDYSTLTSIRQTGGFVPTGLWSARRDLLAHTVALAGRLGIRSVTTHAGFIPASDHPGYPIMLGRVSDVAKLARDAGVDLLFETGQETASELLQFFNDLAVHNVYVNFDPANMLLYGTGEPIAAISTLGAFIRHVHVKDAIVSDQPGIQWGKEVPFGSGQVGAREFLDALEASGYAGPLVIEAERKDNAECVRQAIEELQEMG